MLVFATLCNFIQIASASLVIDINGVNTQCAYYVHALSGLFLFYYEILLNIIVELFL